MEEIDLFVNSYRFAMGVANCRKNKAMSVSYFKNNQNHFHTFNSTFLFLYKIGEGL